jgi:filamentous hemagglutinin
MHIRITGQNVCGYCRSDIISMAKKAELNSVTIFEEASGKTLRWQNGQKGWRE